MKVEVEVFSWVDIKPSSPTPPHLRTYKLSFLDQTMAPQVYMPFIFFYESNNDNELSNLCKSKKIKASLSETLTHFYPLAGRFSGNFSINCNDEGVPFLEARVKSRLSDVVHDSSPSTFDKFLPHALHVVSNKVLSIQLNFFECGSMAVAVCLHHTIADAFSKLTFINFWASTCRGDHKKIVSPKFESAQLFPPRNITMFDQRVGINMEKIAVRRLLFKNSVITALMDKYIDKNSGIRPTRVGALTIFIWNRYVSAIRDKTEPERLCLVVHPVDVRKIMKPPIAWYSFGNYFRLAMTPTSIDASNECQELLRKVTDTIKNVEVGDLQAGDGHLSSMVNFAQEYKKGITLSFSSLCNFPLYEQADFGWGKPLRVGSSRLALRNMVIFMDTKERDGIDAWINMNEEEMAKFEMDKELLAFISPVSKY